MESPKFDPLVIELLEIFKEIRLKKGMSHQQVADKAHVSRAIISFMESKKRNPTVQLAGRLASALGYELSALIKMAEKRVEK